MTKIENGCMLLNDGRYRYDYTTVKEGYKTLFFTIKPGEVPEIGDFITDDFKLKKREGIQVTNDGSRKWVKRPEEPIQFGHLYEK